MKKFIIMSALVMGGLGITTADAQFGIHINLHLGTRTMYVPAPPAEVVDQPVYNDDDYYYLPDVEAYYSVNERCYYYQDGGRWVSAAYLPGRYHDFDWRNAKRYEIHANRPYMHDDAYRSRFGGYTNRDDYYARAYPNRGRYQNNGFRGDDQYNNRGWGQQNRGGFERHDNLNQNAYSQAGHNQGGSYNQNNQGGYNQGGYNQPAQNQSGYDRSVQNAGRNQNGNNNNSQGNNSGNQPSQGQQGGRNNGQGQGSSQPANHNGGQNSGSYAGTDHYAANKMGVVQDRGEFARPVRN